MKPENEITAAEANARLLARRKQVKISLDDPKAGKVPTIKPADVPSNFERLLEIGREEKKFADSIAAQLAKMKPHFCEVHKYERKPDLRATVAASRETRVMTPRFEPCPTCKIVASGPEAWMIKVGVPMELAHATLDNWSPRNEEETAILEAVRKFRKFRTGFIVMLGKRGTGKSHLGVALIKEWRCGLMITQANLLYRLRRSYGNNGSEDIIEKCRATPFLVIDEMGLSAGGKDEFPMLHEILSYRHGAFKPTVLTGNIQPGELAEIIGDRMVDRLQQSIFKQLLFNGESNRKERRAEYEAKAISARK